MSTNWGFACVSHDPPLISDHWFNHGAEALRQVFRLERAGAWPNDPDLPVVLGEPLPVEHRGYATSSPIRWLRDHPRCQVVLHNEYGDTEPLEADGGG